MGQMTSRRLAGTIGIATLLAAILTGCAVAAVRPSPSVAASATARAASSTSTGMPTAAPVPRLSDLAPGTLIATGEFRSPVAAGKIQIKANGLDHGFDVILTGLRPVPVAGTTIEFNALPSTASDTQLQDGFSFYRYEPLSQVSDQNFRTPGPGYGGFETDDPSYMRTAVIWAAPSGFSVGRGSVFATAALTWDVPTMKAVPKVADHGSADGARGQAGLAGDGTPVSYRIASNDTVGRISARFGVTADDLQWLNPDRLGLPGGLILADSTINLSGNARGLRW